jgi:hypothetical protein
MPHGRDDRVPSIRDEMSGSPPAVPLGTGTGRGPKAGWQVDPPTRVRSAGSAGSAGFGGSGRGTKARTLSPPRLEPRTMEPVGPRLMRGANAKFLHNETRYANSVAELCIRPSSPKGAAASARPTLAAASRRASEKPPDRRDPPCNASGGAPFARRVVGLPPLVELPAAPPGAGEAAIAGVRRFEWSGRADLNCRPLAPQASTLAKLSYGPFFRQGTGAAFLAVGRSRGV